MDQGVIPGRTWWPSLRLVWLRCKLNKNWFANRIWLMKKKFSTRQKRIGPFFFESVLFISQKICPLAFDAKRNSSWEKVFYKRAILVCPPLFFFLIHELLFWLNQPKLDSIDWQSFKVSGWLGKIAVVSKKNS